ncbi:MAG: (Fe-S)-binding protein, partial [Fidelibacterota bacterium]
MRKQNGPDPDLEERIRRTNALACLDCGKCTSVCPVSLFGRNSHSSGQYSPRVILTRAVRRDYNSLFEDYRLWSCLTCKKCDQVCPSDIRYLDLMYTLRSSARGSGLKSGGCTHSGALDALSTLMTAENLKQNRLEWVTDDLQVSSEGEVLYFVGCAPYFDAFFTDLDLSTLEAARSSIKILNALDISPVLLPDERCCGHDLYWNGDVEHFKILADHNVSRIKGNGVRTVLFSCAECLSAFKNLYPAQGYDLDVEFKHMSQFLAEKVESGEIKMKDARQVYTYQDPCRLGRHLGIYDEPRRVLSHGSSENGGPSSAFHEMRHTRKQSLCCGVSAWMNCDVNAKSIQMERLRQANDTGADVLAVACPKCQIHLICTLKDKTLQEGYEIKIQDIASVALERMKQRESPNR